MELATIDFETYYDETYSLSKITTEEYIRSPLFETIGFSIKFGDTPAIWYSGNDNYIRDCLHALNFADCAVLAHHTAFDAAILSWRYGIRPRFLLDSLSMSRPFHKATVGGSLKMLAEYHGIGEKGEEVIKAKSKRRVDFTETELQQYGIYCCNDNDLCYKLFQIYKKLIPVSELMVIDQMLRMYTEPVIELDRELLQEHLADVLQRKANLMDLASAHKDDLMSNIKFAELLESMGVDPPKKMSLRTGREAYAFAKTDQGLLDLQEHPDLRVQALVAARLGVKSTIEETRTQRLIDTAHRGPLPIMLNYYGAHTGRFSGGDKLNLQNLPKRGNTTIRKALRAPKGFVFMPCDSRQIEARIVAWLAKQQDLLDAFQSGRDTYVEFASELYNVPISQIDKLRRFVGKTCQLGLGYGMGDLKLMRTLHIGQGGVSVDVTREEATAFVRYYRTKYHKVPRFWNKCNAALGAMVTDGRGNLRDDLLPFDADGIMLPNGLRLQYPMLRAHQSNYVYCSNVADFKKIAKKRIVGADVDADDSLWTKVYGGLVTENVTQALAALIVRGQAVDIGKRYKVAFQVHDENVPVVPISEIADAQEFITQVMRTAPAWAEGLPLDCEISIAETYGDA